MQHIRTKWHKIMPLVNEDEVFFTDPGGSRTPHWESLGADKEKFRSFMRQFEVLPHFVVDRELLEIATKREYESSILDMKRAGVFRLPFPAMIVEYANEDSPNHTIVLLRDMHHPEWLSWEDDRQLCYTRGDWSREPDRANKDQTDHFDFYGFRMSVEVDQWGEYLCMSPSFVHLGLYQKEGAEPLLAITAMGNGLLSYTSEAVNLHIQSTMIKDTGCIWHAAVGAYLIMATGGVVKEVIETDRVNRKRDGVIKPYIPKHTYIRIGHVYRSEKSDQTDDYVPRRSPIPHWRRGHNKTVRFGPGRNQTKLVYIYPKLVAYKGGVTPEPKKPEYVVTD